MDAFLAGICIWWLVYFNCRDTRELFQSQARLTFPADIADRNITGTPTAIEILGYSFLFSTLYCAVFGFLPFPAFLFILSAKASHFLNFTIAILWGLAGYGLLRLKDPARLLAIAILLLSCCNVLLAILLPWYRQYMVHCISMLPDIRGQLTHDYYYSETIIISGSLFALIINGSLLWLLHRHRAAFKAPAPPAKPLLEA